MNTRLALICAVLGLSCAACDESDSGQSGGSGETTTAQNTGASADRASNGRSGTTGGAAGADESDASVSPPAVDYAQPENWLCRPGHSQACDVDLDTTIVQADGTTMLEKFVPDPDPKIDCFYIYPTVSLDTGTNSDLNPGPEEASVVRAQFARFASQCRLFAPMYRQLTLAALTKLLTTTGSASATSAVSSPESALGYNDVLDAWHYYLQHDNGGRGIVLVGHSQGSSVLTQLIKDELDQSPDKRLLAALLLGTDIMVPKDKDVGGTFKNVPICRSNEQLGCVIVYASFRANTPPTANSSLSLGPGDPSMVTACANPAALGGGSAELHSYLSTAGPGNSSTPMGPWVKDGPAIDTPFVSVPGLITAECKLASEAMENYLAITVHGDPSDPRTDDIVGDVVINGVTSADFGLHLIDVHLTMGNLLDVVHAKAQAFVGH